MYFFTIQATAKPGTQQAEETGGAYINCWINFVSQDGAELLARYYIEQSDWVPGEKMEERWLEAKDYVAQPELLQYYRQAEEEGTCFIYHTWPMGAGNDDSDNALN